MRKYKNMNDYWNQYRLTVPYGMYGPKLSTYIFNTPSRLSRKRLMRKDLSLKEVVYNRLKLELMKLHPGAWHPETKLSIVKNIKDIKLSKYQTRMDALSNKFKRVTQTPIYQFRNKSFKK